MRIDFTKAILVFCLFLSFVRGTNIGLFYPADEFDIGTIDYTFQTVTNFVLLLGISAYFFLTNDYSFLRQRLSRVSWLVPAILALACLALSTDRVESAKFLVAMTVITLPSLIYIYRFGAEKILAALGTFVVVCAFVNLGYVLAFPEYGIMSGHHMGRWKGLFEHKNMSGPFFALGFFIVAARLDIHRPFRLVCQMASLPVCLAFVYYAQSSTAWVLLCSMAFCLLFFRFLYRLQKPFERIAILLLGVFSSLMVIVYAGPFLMGEFFALTGKDATLTGRTGIWKVILNMVSFHPLAGYGPGMAERPDFMEQIQGDVGWAAKGTHNSFLDLLLGFGYPLTVLFTLLLFKTWFSSFFLSIDTKGRLASCVIASSLIVSILAFAFSGSGALLSRTIFWLMMAISLGIIAHLSTSPSKMQE